jgi:hypothetical protein
MPFTQNQKEADKSTQKRTAIESTKLETRYNFCQFFQSCPKGWQKFVNFSIAKSHKKYALNFTKLSENWMREELIGSEYKKYSY